LFSSVGPFAFLLRFGLSFISSARPLQSDGSDSLTSSYILHNECSKSWIDEISLSKYVALVNCFRTSLHFFLCCVYSYLLLDFPHLYDQLPYHSLFQTVCGRSVMQYQQCRSHQGKIKDYSYRVMKGIPTSIECVEILHRTQVEHLDKILTRSCEIM
jgi:hypothetical protein